MFFCLLATVPLIEAQKPAQAASPALTAACCSLQTKETPSRGVQRKEGKNLEEQPWTVACQLDKLGSVSARRV